MGSTMWVAKDPKGRLRPRVGISFWRRYCENDIAVLLGALMMDRKEARAILKDSGWSVVKCELREVGRG